MNGAVATHKFTANEYYRMYEAGIIRSDQRVELIEGEIVDMSPIGGRHRMCVIRLDRELNRRLMELHFFDKAIVDTQNPIRLDNESEPQPDVLLLLPKDYSDAHPGASDALLVIEVADTSTDYDRNVKIPLYARFKIPEAWIVDLNSDYVDVFREPDRQGYQKVERYGRGQSISLQAFPQVELTVDGILG